MKVPASFRAFYGPFVLRIGPSRQMYHYLAEAIQISYANGRSLVLLTRVQTRV